MKTTAIAALMGAPVGEMWAARRPIEHAGVVFFHPHLRHPLFLGILVGFVCLMLIVQQLAKISRPMAAIWDAWNRLLHVIGNFEARVVLTLLYAVIVMPFGLLSRLFSDSLRIKHPPTAWLDHPEDPNDMQWAKRQ
jgi:hypothetical protein